MGGGHRSAGFAAVLAARQGAHHLQPVRFTPWRHQVNAAAVVGVRGAVAGSIGRPHRDHPAAPRGAEGAGIRIGVARRHHDQGPGVAGLVDGLLEGRGVGAGHGPPQRHIDDLGRVGVGRNPGHAQTGGPARGAGHVGQGAAAPAQGAPRKQPGPPGHPRHPQAVVGRRGDRAGDVVAVVVAAGRGVFRVAIPPIAVARVGSIGVKIVAGQQFSGQVGMAGHHPPVNHRHCDRVGAAGLEVPGLGQPDGLVVPALIGVQGVVGRGLGKKQVVGVGKGHIAAALQLGQHGQGLGPAQAGPVQEGALEAQRPDLLKLHPCCRELA